MKGNGGLPVSNNHSGRWQPHRDGPPTLLPWTSRWKEPPDFLTHSHFHESDPWETTNDLGWGALEPVKETGGWGSEESKVGNGRVDSEKQTSPLEFEGKEIECINYSISIPSFVAMTPTVVMPNLTLRDFDQPQVNENDSHKADPGERLPTFSLLNDPKSHHQRTIHPEDTTFSPKKVHLEKEPAKKDKETTEQNSTEKEEGEKEEDSRGKRKSERHAKRERERESRRRRDEEGKHGRGSSRRENRENRKKEGRNHTNKEESSMKEERRERERENEEKFRSKETKEPKKHKFSEKKENGDSDGKNRYCFFIFQTDQKGKFQRKREEPNQVEHGWEKEKEKENSKGSGSLLIKRFSDKK